MSEGDGAALNENFARHLKISPQLLEIVSDDPEQLAKLHRIQRALLSEKATRICLEAENISPAQLGALIDTLRKAEGPQEKRGVDQVGNGFYFQIIMPESGKTLSIDTRPPIEGKATEVA
jgi:hypothetical protein